MPPTNDMIVRAIKCLGKIKGNLTASPMSVTPGQASKLKWNVTTPNTVGCSVQLFLNNSPVQKTGTRSIQPGTTATYRLIGKMFTVHRTLGTVTVAVDVSQCFIQSVDEETVRQLLQNLITSAMNGSPLSQRSPASIEIDQNGIAVKLRLKVAVPNFFDPDLNVDMVIGVSAVSSNVVVSYKSYSNDLDWPWWVTGITVGITKIIEEIIESKIEKEVKPLILEKLKEQIDSFLSLIPPTYRLHSLTTESNEIRAMVCPIPGGGNTPFNSDFPDEIQHNL